MSQSYGSLHGHGHGDEHQHDHHHEARGSGVLARLRHVLRLHSHKAADKVDTAMEASAEGMRGVDLPGGPGGHGSAPGGRGRG